MGTRRVLNPGTVTFQNHHWYLSGVEAGSDMVKHFAVGRMSDTTLDKPGSASPVPQVQRIPLHPLHWQVDESVEVVLRTPADYVPDVERWLFGPDRARPGEGWVEMTCVVTNRAAFRAWIYVLGTRVTLVGPPEFRAEMLDELREMAGA